MKGPAIPFRKQLGKATRLFLLQFYRIRNRRDRRFHCPVCSFRGPFKDDKATSGTRKFARCPSCGALERHRLQHLVIDKLRADHDFKNARFLHFAPEDFFRGLFGESFSSYVTADLDRPDVDLAIDITTIPFNNESVDIVFASHVLEHVERDDLAIAEIHRVLKPGGFAVLPVPIVAELTIEYPGADPLEDNHVRAPGLDYFDRFRKVFDRVVLFDSFSFPNEHQLVLYEDRTVWPTVHCRLRRPMPGSRHSDYVPVCFK